MYSSWQADANQEKMPPPPGCGEENGQCQAQEALGMGSAGHRLPALWLLHHVLAREPWGHVSCRASPGPCRTWQSHSAGAHWAQPWGTTVARHWRSQARVVTVPAPDRAAHCKLVCRGQGCTCICARASGAVSWALGSNGGLALGEELCQWRAAGRAGVSLSMPGFPVTLICSLAQRSCHHPAGPRPPKPDARVTLGLPSPTSPVLCWHVFHRCLQAPN